MEKLINCPDCCSTKIVKNGSIGNGKYKCKRCGRQFVLDPQKQPISNKQLIGCYWKGLSGIARSVKVSERWLPKKNKGRITIECDEIYHL